MRIQPDKAALGDNRVAGAHADCDDHVGATLGRAYSPQSSRKSEIVAGYGEAIGRSRRHHGERGQKHERENQTFNTDSPHGEFFPLLMNSPSGAGLQEHEWGHSDQGWKPT